MQELLQEQQQESLGIKPTRVIRLDLTKEQINLLVNYALRYGFKRHRVHHDSKWTTKEETDAVKYSIMSRLGFDDAK